MKKVILSLVFVFATGTMMNASSSKEEITTTITRTLEKANDCFWRCLGIWNCKGRWR